MFSPPENVIIGFSADQQPLLVVIVDAEEEFDWDNPFSRDNTYVIMVRNQARAHAVF